MVYKFFEKKTGLEASVNEELAKINQSINQSTNNVFWF